MKGGFDRCFDWTVMIWEGGSKETNRKADFGGQTRYGISKKYHPDVDLANLDEAGARAWYLENVWNFMKCDDLPAPLDRVVFDSCTMFGPDDPTAWMKAQKNNWKRMLVDRVLKHARVVLKYPLQATNIYGWVLRTFALYYVCETEERNAALSGSGR